MQPYLDFSVPQAYTDANESEALPDGNVQPHVQHLYAQSTAAPMLESSKAAFYPPTLPSQMSCEIKPRLTKEQHDVLEAHYQQQNKPPTTTKRAFAESLNVSMEKVNNWFQNRRAKAKQDAKKQTDNLNNSQYASQPDAAQTTYVSESEISPVMAIPSEYLATMEQWNATQYNGNGVAAAASHMTQQQPSLHVLPTQSTSADAQMFGQAGAPQNAPMFQGFDSSMDFNRRTLTQEQFDEFARNGGMVDGNGGFSGFQTGFLGNDDILKQIFPDLLDDDYKPHEMNPYNCGTSISSYDSGIHSTALDQSFFAVPSTTDLQNAMSASSSEYAESRTSSLSLHDESSYLPQNTMAPPPSRPALNHSQWQPGQSVPVDINALNEQFRQAAQAAHDRQASPQNHTFEQPAPWLSDEAFARRGSQTTLLTQSMSNVGIDTPQPGQTATFKSPAPPSNIAARRRRPRPAALGTAALRSQSYTDGAGPFSASPIAQPTSATAAPNLRRIRSSNVVGSVAQGRVMKSIPGSAQRSPLSWTFTDSLQSPSIAQHMSQSQESLAPPTPRSPSVWPPADPLATSPLWQTPMEQSNRQPPILESDAEPGISQPPSDGSVNASLNVPVGSPPHTPLHVQQQYFLQQQQMWQQQQNGHRPIPENTPPQSAPASQQTFPGSIFATLPLQPQHNQAPMQPPPHAPKLVPQPQQQYMNVIMPKPPASQGNVVYPPQQQLTSNVSGPSLRTPVQFANGVPIINAEGNMQMAFPQQAPFIQQQQQQRQAQLAARRNSYNAIPINSTSPAQTTYQFMTPSGVPPSQFAHVQASQFMPAKNSAQNSSELMVREYSPPEEMKRNATLRRGAEITGPKSYTFANHTPEHFEKGRKADAKTSSNASTSPISSTDSIMGSSVAS